MNQNHAGRQRQGEVMATIIVRNFTESYIGYKPQL